MTSLGQRELVELGINESPQQRVSRLADLAQQTRLDGVVCSPMEAAELRQQFAQPFCLVTPGIRPLVVAGAVAGDDQRRVMSAAQAVYAGADYLVVGRPITQADDPLAALQLLNTEICNLT